MTQTVKGKNIPPQKQTTPSQRQRRPGQRQQERLQRIERRRRRQRIWLSVTVALVVIALAGVTLWQYQRITAQQAATHSKNASGTKSAAAATATASTGPATATPSAGPATPPPVTGTPITTNDGLEYLDVKVGTGTAAAKGSTVQVQYTGWLASNGKKFDSSYDHGGQPFSVTLGQGQVIPGWDEGLIGMKPGGTRRLLIPPALGYGANGQPPTIPGNATLLFDVTMISVK
jgi:FKBP-type peptidyl-prolyl cis-trans isomerase